MYPYNILLFFCEEKMTTSFLLRESLEQFNLRKDHVIDQFEFLDSFARFSILYVQY